MSLRFPVSAGVKRDDDDDNDKNDNKLCKSVDNVQLRGNFQYCMVCLFSVSTKHCSTKYSNLSKLNYFYCLYFVVKFSKIQIQITV